MDRLTVYRQYIQAILAEYSHYKPAYGDVELETIYDVPNDHYQLLSVGWNKHQRVHGTILHLDIRGSKIWVQYDGTEEGIANRLIELGVPREDIVLGFHPPYQRQYTEFSTG